MATSTHPRIQTPAHTEHCALCGRPIRPSLLANSGTTLENGRLVHVACLQPAQRPPSTHGLDLPKSLPKRPPSSLSSNQPAALIPRPPSTHAADLPKVMVPLRPPSSLATKLPKAVTAPPLHSPAALAATVNASPLATAASPGPAARWPRWLWAVLGAVVGMAVMALLFWLFHRSDPTPANAPAPAPAAAPASADNIAGAGFTLASAPWSPILSPLPTLFDPPAAAPAVTAAADPSPTLPIAASADLAPQPLLPSTAQAAPMSAPAAPPTASGASTPSAVTAPAVPAPAAPPAPFVPAPDVGATLAPATTRVDPNPAADDPLGDDPLPGQHRAAKQDGRVLLNLDGKTAKPDTGQWKRMTVTTDGAETCLQWRGNVPEIVPVFQLDEPLATPAQVNVHLRFKVDAYADRTLILRATYTDPLTQTERHTDLTIAVKAAGSWVTGDGVLRNLAGPLTQLELRPPSPVQEGMLIQLSQLVLSDGPAKGVAAPKAAARPTTPARTVPPPVRAPVAQPRPVWTPPATSGAGQARQAQQAGQTPQTR